MKLSKQQSKKIGDVVYTYTVKDIHPENRDYHQDEITGLDILVGIVNGK